jgi:hypothetical protein
LRSVPFSVIIYRYQQLVADSQIQHNRCGTGLTPPVKQLRTGRGRLRPFPTIDDEKERRRRVEACRMLCPALNGASIESGGLALRGSEHEGPPHQSSKKSIHPGEGRGPVGMARIMKHSVPLLPFPNWAPAFAGMDWVRIGFFSPRCRQANPLPPV